MDKSIPNAAQKGSLDTYSVCMLCSNDGETVKASVDSVLELSKYRTIEVVITDNMSRDRSKEVLHEYRDKGLIKLVEQRCSRGVGRQLAFSHSKGDYVLAQMDCDDIFDAKGINSLLMEYHSRFEGMVLMTKSRDPIRPESITIAPRQLLVELGGWRPLNWGEDWDLWARAAALKKYSYLPYPVGTPPHQSIRVRHERYRGATHGFRFRVEKYGEAIRAGRKVFEVEERVSVAQRLAYCLARAGVIIRRNRLSPVPNPNFYEYTVMGEDCLSQI